MAVADPPLIISVDAAGRPLVGLGVPLLDEYLEFVAGRCRPNTVLATAFDLKVFFDVVGKAPAEVTAADVLGFITAQRTGGENLRKFLARHRNEELRAFLAGTETPAVARDLPAGPAPHGVDG